MRNTIIFIFTVLAFVACTFSTDENANSVSFGLEFDGSPDVVSSMGDAATDAMMDAMSDGDLIQDEYD